MTVRVLPDVENCFFLVDFPHFEVKKVVEKAVEMMWRNYGKNVENSNVFTYKRRKREFCIKTIRTEQCFLLCPYCFYLILIMFCLDLIIIFFKNNLSAVHVGYLNMTAHFLGRAVCGYYFVSPVVHFVKHDDKSALRTLDVAIRQFLS